MTSSELAFAELPESLRERTRPISATVSETPGTAPSGSRRSEEEQLTGEFVLYWMRTAARGHENPALDVAIATAGALGVPAVVYHAVDEDYPYASDRLHTFIMQGARDVARELEGRGIGHLFHVDRRGQRGPHLEALTRRALILITEDMPVQPLVAWTRSLAADTATPVWAVDTDCIVPMQMVDEFHDRAYKFRRATDTMRAERIRRPWTSVEPQCGPFVPDALPFEPVDIRRADIPALVAECDIDHGVGPVPRTRGGSEAGYARWRRFRDDGLLHYHKTRNDPTRPEGASRMSPYLHFGHVSPFRLARQAAEMAEAPPEGPNDDRKGPEKYIDEMVVWRELAHHFCFHREDHDSVSALPDWARESLRRHEDDPREALYDWETLARGRTDDRLWNLTQTSLRVHGELHNNVRMTWAKKFLEWTPDVERALELAIDLNHRYALDGRDPNSYLGIQWCFGAFDRPFTAEDPEEERPILGRVRPRDTDWHAGRLNMERYADIVQAPPDEPAPRVAVIGAGLAGLTCARTLHDHRLPVTVFEKSRGAGGRASTRRIDADQDRDRPHTLTFDHGAQYFTARGDTFRRHVDAWRQAGVVERWDPRLAVVEAGGIRSKTSDTERFVGQPGMSALTAHLAEDLEDDCHYRTRVGELERHGGTWRLHSTDGEHLGDFEVVVLTAPPAQTAELLEGTGTSLIEQVHAVSMDPTWALLVAFDEPLGLDFDAAFVNDGPLDWIARNTSKPGRLDDDGPESWTVHAGSAWSSEHLEMDKPEAARRLLTLFAEAIGMPKLAEERATTYLRAHRWRYAKASSAAEEGCLLDAQRGLVVCGDWLAGSRIEGAFNSGRAGAGGILSRCMALGRPEQPSLLD